MFPGATPAFSSYLCRVIACLAAALVSGCYTSLTDRQMFVARDRDTNDLSIVRVTVHASADMSDLDFRAAYVDSDAIDEVIHGELKFPDRPEDAEQATMLELRRKIVVSAANDLTVAFSRPWSPETRRAVVDAEEKLLQARSLLRRSRTRETSDVPDSPAEKFVIAVSADPDKVFQALADATSQQEQQTTMLDAVRSLAARAGQQNQVRHAAAENLWQALLSTAPAPDAADDSAALRAKLLRYSTQLNDYLSAVP